jgi:hypothetical protein
MAPASGDSNTSKGKMDVSLLWSELCLLLCSCVEALTPKVPVVRVRSDYVGDIMEVGPRIH